MWIVALCTPVCYVLWWTFMFCVGFVFGCWHLKCWALVLEKSCFPGYPWFSWPVLICIWTWNLSSLKTMWFWLRIACFRFRISCCLGMDCESFHSGYACFIGLLPLYGLNFYSGAFKAPKRKGEGKCEQGTREGHFRKEKVQIIFR